MIYVYIFILYKVHKYSILSYSIELRSYFFPVPLSHQGFFLFISLVFTSFSLQSCCAIECFWLLPAIAVQYDTSKIQISEILGATPTLYIIFRILFNKSGRYISKSFSEIHFSFHSVHCCCYCCCCLACSSIRLWLQLLIVSQFSMCTFYWFPSLHCHLFIYPEDIILFTH